MRKLLFTLILILVLVVTGMIIYKGVTTGNIDIWGIKQIVEENKKIDTINEQLSTLVNTTYPSAVKATTSSAETLEKTKKEYETQAILLSESENYAQSEKYKIEFLWTRIGNYAKANKVVPEMKVTNSATKDRYNLNFVVEGKYSDIAKFIFDIENDSRLGFKIENFSMTSGGETTETEDDEEESKAKSVNTVIGKFVCKEIRIDLEALDLDVEDELESEEEAGTANQKQKESETKENSNSTETNNTTENTTEANNTNESTNVQATL